jgi:5-methylphenazine-1-carboxylate 1-monooxygenase
VTLRFVDTATGANAPSIQATVAIACDGVNSAARRQFYPDEQLVFTGINTWRGVTRGKPILDGRTYFRIGSIKTGKIVIYPIADDIDGEGKQLINWTTEIQTNTDARNDWNKPGRLEDFYAIYESWTFDWLNVAELIRNSESIFEYPMVDKDPIARWTFGRVTLAGDAAHPMYPRGSNGSAQGLIDARTLADSLQQNADPLAALTLYEQARTDATARVVRANRENPPDFINIKVEELTGDRPFENLDDFISQADLRRLSEQYKAVAGFDLARLSGGNPAAKAGS